MTNFPVITRNELDNAGYRHVEQVLEHGEYATRGALLDLFPMGSSLPFRIDFFDDEIDSLRTFDVDSQRTLEEVEQINLLPAHEFPTDKDAIERFRSQWRERFEVRRDQSIFTSKSVKIPYRRVSSIGSLYSLLSHCHLYLNIYRHQV